MRQRTFVLVGSALALMVASGFAAKGPGGEKKDSQVSLVRPESPPDSDAKGSLRIRSDKNRERFDIHVEKVDGSQAHEVWIEDPADSALFTQTSTLEGNGGSLSLKLDTKKGDPLPLGAVNTEALVGRRVEIRAGGQVVLQGEVPPYGLSKKPAKAKVDISAPDGAPAPDMSGKLSLRSKANKGQERIDLKTKHVPWNDGPFRVFVEDGVASAVFVDGGDLEQDSDTEGHFRRDTKQGQSLPGGVNFVSELAGRTIEVRNGADVVYLRGTIPTLE
jgi:hypothetical protein